MTIHLPSDLESSIQAAVQQGRFASVDEAMSEAARMLLRQIKLQNAPLPPTSPDDPCLGAIGAMRNAADELDEAMSYASELRQQPWRVPPSE